MEKIFAIYYYDRGLKRAEELIRYFIKKTAKMVHKYFCIPQFYLLSGKMQIKSTMKYQYTPIGIHIIEKPDNMKGECEATQTHIIFTLLV